MEKRPKGSISETDPYDTGRASCFHQRADTEQCGVDIELLVPVAVAVVVGGRRGTNRRMMTRHIRDVKGEVNKLPHTSRVRDLMTHKGRSVTTVTMSAS